MYFGLLSYLIPLFVIGVLLIGSTLVLSNIQHVRQGRKMWKEVGLLWILLGWFLGAGLITLMPFSFGDEHTRVLSLIPFEELLTNGVGVGGAVVKEGLANVLLFVVGGALFSLVRRSTITFTTVFLTGFAIVIEAGQYVLNIGRVSSIDDVVWAALGALLGAGIVRMTSSARTSKSGFALNAK